MKPFEERYQNFFKKITTPKQMQIQIKETILNQQKSKKNTFRFAIAAVILAFLLISSIVGVTAYTFVKHHKTVKNNEYFKSVEVYQDKIDADVNVSDIKDKKNYTRSEIENLLGIKILKNNFIKSDQFKLHSFLENIGKIKKRII